MKLTIIPPTMAKLIIDGKEEEIDSYRVEIDKEGMGTITVKTVFSVRIYEGRFTTTGGAGFELADYNPRKDLQPGDPEYESLKKSIKRWGVVEPIIWKDVKLIQETRR